MPVDEALKTLWALVAAYALSVLGGVAILVAGWLVASWAARGTERLLRRLPRIDPMLVGFLASLVRYGALTLVGIAVLGQFGVQTASIIAVFGATGLAIGLALQGTLANFAAGAMLLLFRPFTVGDQVQLGGHRGQVRELNMFTTNLDSMDNVRVILPNGKVWGDIIQNLSANDRIRIAVECVIPWDQDAEEAGDLIRQRVAEAPGIMPDTPPRLVITKGDAAGVTLRIEAWTQARQERAALEGLGWAISRTLGELRRRPARQADSAGTS
jgi:small conductance mechanosensitive channel